ncbi:helix-turn-helix domain-containing protein [Streptacidiphilus sp. N1-10]|uniref:Helix-turn-helix domain-containing protein n=1 Tax=Streptacidiphilus jeojiensis TaxID=3229225 RepID=A0ABV6XNM2_9ACTN
MTPDADPVKRTYRSPARAAAAAATRARIREAAERLFVEQGYVATALRQIATAAGVGERTLYDAFPTKAALFAHTLGVATVGDEEPVRVADRPEITASREQADPRAAIGQLVAYSTALLERAGDLIMVSVEAAGADPDMRAASDAGAEATHAVHLALTRRLHADGALRTDLDPVTAADILYALGSPHMHQLLRRHRGWTVDHYRTWLQTALVHELLDTGQDGPR